MSLAVVACSGTRGGPRHGRNRGHTVSHPRTHARLRAGRAVARLTTGLLVAAGLTILAPPGSASAAPPTTGAVSTTTNITASQGNGACLNGPSGVDPVNCNQYSSKEDVWLSGLPNSAHVGDGTYFFAIMEPGGQPDPNDGGAKNLSDAPGNTPRSDRVFTIENGVIDYSGSHGFENNKLQAFPYDDTGNPGGVYILAVCQLPDDDITATVKPSSCKYDAFKVQESDTTQGPEDLTIVKDAEGDYTTTYRWTVTKSGDLSTTTDYSGNVKAATGSYSVAVDKGAGVLTAVGVTGTITVFNPNSTSVTGADVTDVLSDGVQCTVTGGADATIAPGDNDFPYSCTLDGIPPQLDNNAYVAWPDPADATKDKTASFTFSDIQFDHETVQGSCVDVTDSMHGALGSTCASTTYSYTQTLAPSSGCQDYTNTATATTQDTKVDSTGSKTLTVCWPVAAQKTGAKPLSFWKGTSGQSVVKTGTATSGVCNAGTYLRTYAPFTDLGATATCAATQTYVAKVLSSATASGATAKAQLKGQMLATALNVYYTKTANKTATSALYLPTTTGGVGSTTVALGKVCTTASCTAVTDVRTAFSNYGTRTVSEMLTLAAGSATAAGTTWYGGASATQTKAKNGFNGVNVQGTYGS